MRRDGPGRAPRPRPRAVGWRPACGPYAGSPARGRLDRPAGGSRPSPSGCSRAFSTGLPLLWTLALLHLLGSLAAAWLRREWLLAALMAPGLLAWAAAMRRDQERARPGGRHGTDGRAPGGGHGGGRGRRLERPGHHLGDRLDGLQGPRHRPRDRQGAVARPGRRPGRRGPRRLHLQGAPYVLRTGRERHPVPACGRPDRRLRPSVRARA
jgi:hypothetical protein